MILEGPLTSWEWPSPLGWPTKSPLVKIWRPVVTSLCPPVEHWATSWVSSGWPLTYRGWDLLGTDPEVPGTRKLLPAEERTIWTLGDWATFCRTWGTILISGKAYRRPSRCPREPTWCPWTQPWGPDTAMQTWWVICWRTSQTSPTCGSPHWANTGRRRSMAIVSVRLWTVNLPGCCGLLADGREPVLLPCDPTTSAGATSAAWEYRIECHPHSWCKPLSLRCRTSSAPLGTSDEERSLSRHRWWPASPERWCDTIFEILTTVPVSSAECESNWAPLVVRGRPCRTAGDAHQTTSDSIHWGTVILSDQFPVLWHQAVAAFHVEPVLP